MALSIFQETFGKTLSSGGVFIMAGATVTVRRESDGAIAPIYSDRDGNNAKSNPFNADSNGFAVFYAESGLYRVTASDNGQTVDLRNVEFIGRNDFVYQTVAEMKNGFGLKVGSFARTLGYYTPGDGGGNDYEIVAAGTGTADGGSYIDLSGSGLQARGLFVGGAVLAKQFGAKFDGSTDDTAANQAAIDFAESTGKGEVFGASGVTVVSTITIPSEVVFVGEGPGATEIKGAVDAPVIKIGNGTDPQNRGGVKDLAIRGFWDQGAGTRTNSHGLVVSKSNRSHISNIRVYSAYHAVKFIECSDVDAYNIHVQGGGTDRSYVGFLFPEQGSSTIRNAVQMTNCMAVRCHKYGFRVISGSGSKFTVCEAIGVSTNDETEIGFYVGGPEGVSPSPVQFMAFVSCFSDQMAVGSWSFEQGTAPSMKHIKVSNIWAGGSDTGTGYGLKVDGGIRNTFSNILMAALGGVGLHIRNTTDCSFTGGIVEDHNRSDPASGGASGILIEDSSWNTVQGFNIETTHTTAPDVYSIEEVGASNNNTITGNSCPQGASIGGAGSVWESNKGVKTKAKGTASLPSGSSSVAVSHGLDYTPAFGEIMITPRDDLGDRYNVGSIDSATFTLSCATAPASDRRFGWRVERTVS